MVIPLFSVVKSSKIGSNVRFCKCGFDTSVTLLDCKITACNKANPFTVSNYAALALAAS